MRPVIEYQLLHTALNPKRKVFPLGVFLSFRLDIPGIGNDTSTRIHIAVHRDKRGNVGTVIPNHVVPVAGSCPLPTTVIVSSAIRQYVKRKLGKLGILHIDGLIADDARTKVPKKVLVQ